MAALKKVSARHRRAMELRITGKTIPDIAEEIDVAVGTLERWFYWEPVFKREYEAMQEQVQADAMERLQGLVSLAVNTVTQLVQYGEPDSVKLAAAKDILDRAGLKAPDQVEISGRDGKPIEHRTALTDEERAARVAELLEAARES